MAAARARHAADRARRKVVIERLTLLLDRAKMRREAAATANGAAESAPMALGE